MTTDPNLPLDAPSGPPPELAEKLDEKWAADGPAKGIRVRVPIAVAVLAVVALLGVFGGAQLKSSNASASVTATSSGTGPGGGRNRGQFSGAPNGPRGGGGATFGTVESVNGDTITLTDQQGNTKTITLTSSTTITKTTTGAPSDITTGQTIVVRGTANSDGSTTATNVAIGNGGFGAFGGPGGGGNGGPPPDGSSSSSQN